MAARAILAPKTDHVDAVNSAMIRRLPGQPIELLATDELVPGMDAATYPLERLHSQRGSGLPRNRSVLKTGAIVHSAAQSGLEPACATTSGSRCGLSPFVLQFEILAGPSLLRCGC